MNNMQQASSHSAGIANRKMRRTRGVSINWDEAMVEQDMRLPSELEEPKRSSVNSSQPTGGSDKSSDLESGRKDETPERQCSPLMVLSLIAYVLLKSFAVLIILLGVINHFILTYMLIHVDIHGNDTLAASNKTFSTNHHSKWVSIEMFLLHPTEAVNFWISVVKGQFLSPYRKWAVFERTSAKCDLFTVSAFVLYWISSCLLHGLEVKRRKVIEEGTKLIDDYLRFKNEEDLDDPEEFCSKVVQYYINPSFRGPGEYELDVIYKFADTRSVLIKCCLGANKPAYLPQKDRDRFLDTAPPRQIRIRRLFDSAISRHLDRLGSKRVSSFVTCARRQSSSTHDRFSTVITQ